MYRGRPRFLEIGGNEGAQFSFLRSDGEPSLLPPDQEEAVDEDGNVNFMREASLETMHDWFSKVATYLVHDADWHEIHRVGETFLFHFVTTARWLQAVYALQREEGQPADGRLPSRIIYSSQIPVATGIRPARDVADLWLPAR
ncbi:hypothetical protein EW145_g8679 [Phellinidium pouzarii]|uniref:Uncharacterized protein n=1 Tax=Phellinidium pouzarii TaxID=167371 RepID=A0A4S4K491_9AGAM|nr:hypothetical protein EW145_g8679 [Phellinidium pouzarii]